MTELPALLPVGLAAQLLRLPLVDLEAAIEVGELPVVHRDGTPFVVTRQLLLELGVPADHPHLPEAAEDARAGEVA